MRRKDMNPKLFALAACLLIGNAYTQSDQDYGILSTSLDGVGSNSSGLPRLDMSLQEGPAGLNGTIIALRTITVIMFAQRDTKL